MYKYLYEYLDLLRLKFQSSYYCNKVLFTSVNDEFNLFEAKVCIIINLYSVFKFNKLLFFYEFYTKPSVIYTLLEHNVNLPD